MVERCSINQDLNDENLINENIIGGRGDWKKFSKARGRLLGT